MLPKNFLDKINSIEQRYAQTEEKLASIDITKDAEIYKSLSKDLKELSQIHELYKEYKKVLKDIDEAKELLKDKDLKDLAEKELEELSIRLLEKEKELVSLLVPKDANDNKNVILEIRAGAGGEEAALFASDLLRMYQRYAERKGWRFNILEANKTGLGGYKEVIMSIEGKNVYSHLKYESGVHRVQRVPITESGGRIHTSTITVAVLPEADEADVSINPQDLKIETFRASGAGGQYVNTTESAVRITHIPTGISISCQDERSQLQNKLKAMRILYAKLKDFYEKQKKEETDKERKEQVGTGERSEKIRTYNFSQNRITDHRVNLTLHKLQSVLDGDLDDIISSLQAQELEEKLVKV
jgi:peptide chain release factor 1